METAVIALIIFLAYMMVRIVRVYELHRYVNETVYKYLTALVEKDIEKLIEKNYDYNTLLWKALPISYTKIMLLFWKSPNSFANIQMLADMKRNKWL